jgi:glycogen debranching enzyme
MTGDVARRTVVVMTSQRRAGREGQPTEAARGGAPPEHLESAPYVRAEAREDLLALKAGAVFVCARPDGDIRATEVSGEGLYARDTRHLSRLRVTVGGLPPVLLSSTMESGHHAVVNATNPTLRSGAGASIAQETLNVRRTLLVDDRLYCRVRVRNFGRRAMASIVEVELGADFADVFEVRGVGRRTRGRLLPPQREPDGVRFAYAGADGQRRETLVEVSPAPARVDLDDRGAGVAWDVALGPGEVTELLITVAPAYRDDAGQASTLERAAERLQVAHDEWVTRAPGSPPTTSSSTASSARRSATCTR